MERTRRTGLPSRVIWAATLETSRVGDAAVSASARETYTSTMNSGMLTTVGAATREHN